MKKRTLQISLDERDTILFEQAARAFKELTKNPNHIKVFSEYLIQMGVEAYLLGSRADRWHGEFRLCWPDFEERAARAILWKTEKTPEKFEQLQMKRSPGE